MNSSCKRATSAPVAVIVLVLTVGLLPATAQDGLVLWNTLGSDEEVLNSGFGPDLEFYCCGGGIDVQGDAGYAPGVFGNAVTLAGCPYFTFGRVHNIVLGNLPTYLSPEQGTIEVWYKQDADPVPFQHNPYRVFGGSFGLGSGMAFQSQGDPGPPRLEFGLHFGGAFTQVMSLDDGLSGQDISSFNGTWIHIAAVWDRAGIEGTLETLRLYVDGVRVALATGDVWGTTVGNRVDICGANDVDACGNFFMDNIKLWDFAKTDFSDRFVESPLGPEAVLDIKPGSCPNSFNRKSHGVLPVAIVGSDEFDVTLVDLSTVELSRADGVGGSATPNEGPPGPHSTIDDVATGFAASMECECDALAGDGILDLSMKFRSDDVVAALELNALPAGDLVPLVVTGTLLDGTPFETATDCIRLVPPGTPPGMLSVTSNISAAWLDVSPLDIVLDAGGFAAFDRVFPQGTVVTLTAEATMNGRPLIAWRINGVTIAATSLTRQIVITGNSMTVRAIYRLMISSNIPMLQQAGVNSGPSEPQ